MTPLGVEHPYFGMRIMKVNPAANRHDAVRR